MDLWHALFAVSISLNILGFIWSVSREIYLRGVTRQLVRGSNQSVKAITSVTYTLSELTKSIERDSNLTRHERDQIIRLVVDVEKRITDAIRHNQIPAPNVVVNDFNGDNAQVAQGQNVKQR